MEITALARHPRPAHPPICSGGGRSDIPYPKEPSYLHRSLVFLSSTVFSVLGSRIEGLEHIPASGRLIVAVNHRSLLDPPLAGVAVSKVRYPHFVGKEELFRNPLVGWVLRHCGVIALDRKRGDVGAIRGALSVLEQDGCMILFPEGTRVRPGKASRPKPGIGFLAHRSASCVVPARVWNTEHFPPRGPLRLRFGSPLRYQGDGAKESYQTFSEQVMEAIAGL